MGICVLGHQGMLGHVVARRLREAGIDVHTINERFSAERPERFIAAICHRTPDWCINCVGIGPRSATREQMWEANVELPIACAEKLPAAIQLIHASSDGVFAAERPNRKPDEAPDAQDAYGLSKRQAEAVMLRRGAWVVRCSIVGPELRTTRSLLAWAFQQKNPIGGYTNHWWNGVTTLEWAKLALRLIAGEQEAPANSRVLQPGFVPPVTKCELLRTIIREWQLQVPLLEKEGPTSNNRWLAPNVHAPPLENQLVELHKWY